MHKILFTTSLTTLNTIQIGQKIILKMSWLFRMLIYRVICSMIDCSCVYNLVEYSDYTINLFYLHIIIDIINSKLIYNVRTNM